jgi:hypothetical protein
MKCTLTEQEINDYLDQLLTEEEVLKVEAHLADCDDCREMIEASQMVMTALKELPMKTLPEGFESSLHEQLLKVSEEVKNSKNKVTFLSRFKESKSWQKGLSAVAAVAVIGFIGFGSWPALSGGSGFDSAKSVSSESFDTESSFTMGEPMSPEMAPVIDGKLTLTMSEATSEEGFVVAGQREGTDSNYNVLADESNQDNSMTAAKANDDVQDRKLIKTGQMQLEVLDYDKVIDSITHQVNMLGGYIENSYAGSYSDYYRGEEQELKEGYIVIRIPHESFEDAFREVAGLGDVKSKNQKTDDITNVYRDTVNEVKNLEVREAALREIMNKAENVTEIIEVERELSRVRNDINQLTGNLQAWDRLVSLSSITINIRQVRDLTSYVEPVDPTVFTRARDAFVESTNNLIEWLENVFVGLIGLLPALLPLIILSGIIAVIVILRKRRKTK